MALRLAVLLWVVAVCPVRSPDPVKSLTDKIDKFKNLPIFNNFKENAKNIGKNLKQRNKHVGPRFVATITFKPGFLKVCKDQKECQFPIIDALDTAPLRGDKVEMTSKSVLRLSQETEGGNIVAKMLVQTFMIAAQTETVHDIETEEDKTIAEEMKKAMSTHLTKYFASSEVPEVAFSKVTPEDAPMLETNDGKDLVLIGVEATVDVKIDGSKDPICTTEGKTLEVDGACTKEDNDYAGGKSPPSSTFKPGKDGQKTGDIVKPTIVDGKTVFKAKIITGHRKLNRLDEAKKAADFWDGRAAKGNELQQNCVKQIRTKVAECVGKKVEEVTVTSIYGDSGGTKVETNGAVSAEPAQASAVNPSVPAEVKPDGSGGDNKVKDEEKGWGVGIWILLIVIVVVLVGAAVWFFRSSTGGDDAGVKTPETEMDLMSNPGLGQAYDVKG